jgi:hypothetical protein
VDHDLLVARLCELAGQAGQQLAAADQLIAELVAERDQALLERDRARTQRNRALARCRRLEAGQAA